MAATVQAVIANHLDGITFDYESPISKTDPEREWYVAIVKETTEALHEAVPGSQVSVCVGTWGNEIDDSRRDGRLTCA